MSQQQGIKVAKETVVYSIVGHVVEDISGTPGAKMLKLVTDSGECFSFPLHPNLARAIGTGLLQTIEIPNASQITRLIKP